MVLQFAIALAMGAVGAYYDRRKFDYEVSNWVWVIFGGLGAMLAVARYGLAVLIGVHFLFAVIIAGVILPAFYFFPAYIGGADAKAFIALGVILSPFAVVALVLAVFFLEGYLAIKSAKDRLSWTEIKKLQAPFLSFMLSGVLAAFIAVLIM